MKKLILFLVFSFFLMLPFYANATTLGTGTLKVYWSDPDNGYYFTDYDGEVVQSTFGYTTGLVEIFCISSDDANSVEADITFKTIDAGLGSNYIKYEEAAWIADNWTSFYDGTIDLDTLKGEAQKAIWKIMGVANDGVGSDGTDLDIYDAVMNYFAQNGSYLTSNWVFADSESYQDYLTPFTSVPEPTQMLLFGTGLIALAGIGRKRFLK